MSLLIEGKWTKIKGHNYYDPTRKPKSGVAVSEAKYCKVQQERHRADFLKKWSGNENV